MAAVKSPLTGSDNVEPLARFETPALLTLWSENLGVDVSRELAGVDEVTLFRCRETDLRFFHPPSVAGGPGFYARLQRTVDWYYDPTLKGAGSAAIRWEHRRAKRDLRDADRVLEIGCGDGGFLAYLQTGTLIDVTGIDLNPDAVEAARTKNLAVHRSSLEDAAARWPGRFGAVCAFQTLEHVPAPLSFLKAATTLLRPGGQLVLAVPNAESYLQHLTDNALDLPPHHVTRWTPAALRSLPTILPLILTTLRTEPLAPHNYQAYLKTLRQRLSRPLGRHLPRLLISDFTKPLLRSCLRLGASRLIRGHSLYAVLTRGPH